MSKKTLITGYHVEVEPQRSYYGRDMQHYKDDCEQIAQQIRRHVDNFMSVSVVCESSPVCEYCNADWTETSDTYNCCCAKDEEAEDARQVPA